ncbi:MAG: glycosyltransferase, partial [Thermodesulfovibrionales bacterium]
MSDLLPPKVSVCIPVYNGSDYIAESIESVMGQTYRAFELIVCDNCSTDNTEEIVRGFDDPRIRYIRNPKNLGLVGNANRCLELADGIYICILHHDDVMLPDNLERKVRLLDEHPNVGFVHSNIIVIDSTGEVVSWNIWNEDSRRDYIENGVPVFQRQLSYLPFGASIFIGAVLARRECYDRLGGFSSDLPHCNDSEMWMRMALFYDVACIGTPLVKYRVHPTSTSTSWGDYNTLPYLKEHYLIAEMVFAKHSDRIPQAESLKHQVSRAFAERALQLAHGNLAGRDFATGKMVLKEAIHMSPAIIKDAAFWKIKLGLSGGANLINIYHFFKTIRSRAGLLKKLLQCKLNLIETTEYAPSSRGNPLITFLIPHKDCSVMLKLCIDSISKYTTIDYRIVIADDNSDEKEFNNILDLRTPNISIYRFQKTKGHPFLLEWLY